MTRLALPKEVKSPKAEPIMPGGAILEMRMGTTGPESWKPNAHTTVAAMNIQSFVANPLINMPTMTKADPMMMDALKPTRLRNGL
mmetsp:Transcript_50146/g.131260  ORF Transcript_50146/g.131260 Transcript_50146/m.131260 type:complete len:85 (-) Transcript_50146:415-669(-)